MPTFEKTIQTSVRKYLEAQGAKVVNQHGSGMSEAGIPDLLVCFRGLFLAIEIKQPGAYPTTIQRVQLERFRKAGALADVVRSVTGAEGMIAAAEATLQARARGRLS